MELSSCLVLAVAVVFLCGGAAPASTSTSAAPQPTYNSQDTTPGYVPHATYPYADSYGPISPYEGYLYPTSLGRQPGPSSSGYMSAIMPAAQGALQVALRLFAKVGLFLMGGIALLVVGGLFTSAVCSLTPICTITFMGIGEFDKDTVRSLMTPEKISTAAALVQDAIGKYQRLQRAANQ